MAIRQRVNLLASFPRRAAKGMSRKSVAKSSASRVERGGEGWRRGGEEVAKGWRTGGEGVARVGEGVAKRQRRAGEGLAKGWRTGGEGVVRGCRGGARRWRAMDGQRRPPTPREARRSETRRAGEVNARAVVQRWEFNIEKFILNIKENGHKNKRLILR